MEASIYSIDWSCRPKQDRKYPEMVWDEAKSNWMMSVAKGCDHPFLQKLIDCNAIITFSMSEITMFAANTVVMFHVYDGFVNLECISTYQEERKKGSATLVMRAIVEAAKETKTEIRLRACNVTGHGWNIPNHLAVATGMVKKDKIPTAKLQKWYEKFGFVKVADVIHRTKKAGVNMVFKPE